jgi:hypothetical protein
MMVMLGVVVCCLLFVERFGGLRKCGREMIEDGLMGGKSCSSAISPTLHMIMGQRYIVQAKACFMIL